MSDKEVTQSDRMPFEGVNPILRVRNVSLSVDHYLNVLGFKLD